MTSFHLNFQIRPCQACLRLTDGQNTAQTNYLDIMYGHETFVESDLCQLDLTQPDDHHCVYLKPKCLTSCHVRNGLLLEIQPVLLPSFAIPPALLPSEMPQPSINAHYIFHTVADADDTDTLDI